MCWFQGSSPFQWLSRSCMVCSGCGLRRFPAAAVQESPCRSERARSYPGCRTCRPPIAKRSRAGNNEIGKHLQVFVRENNVDQALRVLKKKMQREGIFREMKRRRAYEKPSERKTREK